MGNKRKYAYRNPNEDEYIFSCLVNYPRWAKDKLTPGELQIFKSETSIRQFINNATTDQKKIILAKRNIPSVTFYLDMSKEEPLLNLKNFNKLYKSLSVASERQKIVDEISANNTFALSSREVLAASYLIAQNCNTPYYYVNINYKRIFNAVDELHLRGTKTYAGSAETKNLKELETFRDTCVNFYLSSISSEHYIKIVQRLELLDMRILMYLFLHRDTFMQKSVLVKLIPGYKSNSIAARLGRLVRDNYIDISRSNVRDTSYTIAEMGIIAVNELIQKLCQQAVSI